MRPASYSYSSYNPHPSFRSRAAAFAISLGVAALVVFLLLRLGILPEIRMGATGKSVSLQLLPGSRSAAQRTHTATKTRQATRSAHTTAHKPQPAPIVPPPPKPPVPPWNVTPLSRDELAQADISSKPTRADERAANGGGAGGSDNGQDSKLVYGPGAGPGGEQLFNADWYPRPPSNAEMAYYMPPGGGPPTGWAEIACRTVPDNRVDNCHELGETPGSGLAKALRRAAWQFHIRPPRVNGRPLIGAWVRIHFDFTEKAAG